LGVALTEETDTGPPAPRPPRQEAQRATAEITEVAPSVLRLQLPIHMPGLGHVNCYAIEDAKGFALVDPGMPGPQAWKAFGARLAAAGVPLRRVHTVVVTHSHIDHFGASGHIRKKTGATVVTHRAFRTWWDPADVDDPEALEALGPMPELPKGRPWDQTTPWGGRHPRPPLKVRLRYKFLRPLMKRWFVAPAPSQRLADADVVSLGGRDWVAVHTPGHTPDHLCLYDPTEGVFLSGDHILPTITPHISGLDAGPDPLSDFFVSLDRMRDVPGVKTVLPAHGHPFTDLVGRAEDIRRHHEERLSTLKHAAGELGEATVEDLSHRLFRQRSWGPMAESETYAHLEHLRLAGAADRRVDGERLLYRLT
jgi:glyoxylase-like metal-dependent hydrolase (beta-lactamase superfamily II)